MLSKMQKMWLWIFGAMFVAPEIIWGDIIQVFKLGFLPIYKDVQIFNDYPIVAFLVIIIEILGISGILYIFNKNNSNFNILLKLFLNVFLVIILLVLILSLIFSYSLSQIQLL